MKTLILTRGKETIVDDDTYEWASQNKWTCSKSGYAVRKRNNKEEKLHRLIMNVTKDQVVDHINGDPLDNRRVNLRICTQLQNARNRKKNYNKKTKGVDFQKKSGTFRARIRVNYKHVYLGDFPTEQEAADAYKKASLFYHGEYGKF